jgi:hypothetical protein
MFLISSKCRVIPGKALIRQIFYRSKKTFLHVNFSPKKLQNCDLPPNKTRGASHCGLAIYIKKYLKAKEELWKLKYPFHHAKI